MAPDWRVALSIGFWALPIAAFGAGPAPHPEPPVIYLHYDYMVGADGHSHEPSRDAVRMVVEAFRAQGIVLHVDPQHSAIPERRVLILEGRSPGPDDPMAQFAGPDFAYLEDLKDQYFRPPQPGRAYHYAIFGHLVACGSPEQCNALAALTGRPDLFQYGRLGMAFINGYDLIVSFGRLLDRFGRVPTDIQVAGVLMHELGHNLGLLHGGADNLDLKPNYFSVMNNLFISRGIGTAAFAGGTQPVSVRVDYSDAALPALDELDVDESVGLQAGNNDISYVFCWLGLGPLPGSGPVDFNCDGDTTGVFHGIELNGDPQGRGTLGGDLLVGHDDWAYVHALLRTPQYITGQRPRGGAVH